MAVKKKRVGANGERRHNYAVVLEDLRAQFKAFGEKLDGVDAKVERLDAKVERLDANVERLDANVERLDAKVERLDAKVERLDAKIENVRSELGFVKLAVLELAKDRRAG